MKSTQKRKTRLWIAAILLLFLVIGGVLMGAARRARRAALADLATVTLRRGPLVTGVEADGVVRSAQSAVLNWETSGEVAKVLVEAGDRVAAGDLLATLDDRSLPPTVILARADLVEAQKALEDLLRSQTQQAQARKAVEDAEKALEEALHPEMQQAQVLAAIAQAQRDMEDAQHQLDILTRPPSEQAIAQVHANILLTEDAIASMEADLADLKKQLNRAFYLPFESRSLYQQLYNALQLQLAQARQRYADLLNRYDQLLAPPDPVDVAVATAALATAQARLEDAQREWERIMDGPSPAEIAVLQAQLDDARREWERLKDGPTADDIAAAEARVAAAQAALNTTRITAPFAGTITRVSAQPGDQVSPGQPAFRLDDTSALLVDAAISEIDIPQVAVGQPARFIFDAVIARQYHGEVIAIAPVGVEQNGAVTYEVALRLTDPDENIRPGMTAGVMIETGRVEDALLVPNQALRSLNGERVVYVLEFPLLPESSARPRPLGWLLRLFGGEAPLGRVRAVPLTLGISSNQESQVVAGDLRPGDVILLNPPQSLLQMPGLVVESP